ncbi:Sulfide dehydrogenase [flavocytochrome c] flavoprotein chain precursor [Legionella moravica]|uniref:Sulfide dehydrogenase [flavocytochrome c] flavoprotein chain n=1 Tax=Legionella moravica TaxID=39962 RepID=A0A378JYC7_9GAMM|nr:Sulfide dehydrogenase [flavocytochrome c] flavoprotein chain precursor [Legionella moravica]STX63653.1 Sulfide dehydrogenase [flavocytochrome c] flavoprotein chain precursor [Legionella moravica]
MDFAKSVHFKCGTDYYQENELDKRYTYLIIGGGCGGLAIASRLNKTLKNQTIALIEPSTTHYYQPLWTLAGAGICHFTSSQKQQKNLIPSGVEWIVDRAVKINPSNQQVHCANGTVIHYDFLVLATGLETRFDLIPGSEFIGTHGICSIYHKESVSKTAQMIHQFKGGNALFTMPPVPIKCAGAPQKIMYLADYIFRKNKVRQNTQITFATAGKTMFSVPSFANSLTKLVAEKGITPLFSHRLTQINPHQRIAWFEQTREFEHDGVTQSETHQISMPYDLLHVVPPMAAPKLIQESGLAVESGAHKDWLKVDMHTLQHLDYKNIFGIGDVTGIPNSKTAAAIRQQAPVVVANLLAVAKGEPLKAHYNGYSACPIITDKGKVILAEFGYDGTLMPTFPFDMTQQRRSMWLLKRFVFPKLYWHGIIKGRA